MSKRVLLTGASGFVGSHVLQFFLKNTDWQFVCTYRNPSTIAHPRVHWVHCDLRRKGGVRNLPDTDFLVNIASEAQVEASLDHPALFIQSNVDLMLNLLDYARNRQSEMLLHLSTDEVYGPSSPGHEHEAWDAPHVPRSPYGASKAAQEDAAIAYCYSFGVPLMIVNTQNIFGEGQPAHKFIPKAIASCMVGREIPIYCDQEGRVSSRFWLHARNLASALLLLSLTCPAYQGIPSRHHVVADREVSNEEVVKAIGILVGREPNIVMKRVDNARPGHELRTGMAASGLDGLWRQPETFEASLARTVRSAIEDNALGLS